MKYIRTKDGIYEIDETTILTSLPPCYKVIKPTDKHYAISQKNIIKMADTIEELCDVFIRIKDRNNYSFFLTSSMEQVEGWENYGAIWTDKGLIYVAKMNEKGELELL